MDSTIILIGPMGAGKSTIGQLLAERLAIPQVRMDELRWDYYNEIGYDEALASQIVQSEEGMLGIYRYWKPFEAHAVERILANHQNCVIDFGAGHSVFEDEILFSRAQAALAPFKNVILLLPSPDLNESVEILNARSESDLQGRDQETDRQTGGLNEHFVKHPSNSRLAKMVVYTKGKTPEETCEEIIQKLKESSPDAW